MHPQLMHLLKIHLLLCFTKNRDLDLHNNISVQSNRHVMISNLF